MNFRFWFLKCSSEMHVKFDYSLPKIFHWRDLIMLSPLRVHSTKWPQEHILLNILMVFFTNLDHITHQDLTYIHTHMVYPSRVSFPVQLLFCLIYENFRIWKMKDRIFSETYVNIKME